MMERKTKKSRRITRKTAPRSKPKVKAGKGRTKVDSGVPDPLGAWHLGRILLPLTREYVYEE